MKKILILGGTQFIGRKLVERLLGMEEYELTLFNRQQTNAGLFPGTRKIKGDRETGDITRIAHERWDSVIDLFCYYPDSLRGVLNCLDDLVDRYIFISTCSVYDHDTIRTNMRDEQAVTLPCDGSQRTDRTAASYGHRKAECERILQETGLDHVILRPALVYGPYDHTDRLYYWLYQARNHDPILLPENGDRKFSLTYVDDLVNTIIKLLTTADPHRIYNTITHPLASIRQIVDNAGEQFQREAVIMNAPAGFLDQEGISQWTDMPLWIQSDHYTYSNQRLQDDLGVELTTFQEGIRNTLDYYAGLQWPVPCYGMTEQSRQGLLEKLPALS